ncbi:hypothetical protein D3C73_926540 [compost metagenome]
MSGCSCGVGGLGRSGRSLLRLICPRQKKAVKCISRGCCTGCIVLFGKLRFEFGSQDIADHIVRENAVDILSLQRMIVVAADIQHHIIWTCTRRSEFGVGVILQALIAGILHRYNVHPASSRRLVPVAGLIQIILSNLLEDPGIIGDKIFGACSLSVVPAQALNQCAISLAGTGAVILFGEIRLQRRRENLRNLAVGQCRLQAFAGNCPIVIIFDGHQQQHAIIFVRRSYTPGIEKRSCVFLHRNAIRGIHSDQHDLRPILLMQTHTIVDHIILGFRVNHIGKIVHIK